LTIFSSHVSLYPDTVPLTLQKYKYNNCMLFWGIDMDLWSARSSPVIWCRYS